MFCATGIGQEMGRGIVHTALCLKLQNFQTLKSVRVSICKFLAILRKRLVKGL